MSGKAARAVFLIVCVILAVLLLAGAITTVTSGALFALALGILGGLSKGFRKR